MSKLIKGQPHDGRSGADNVDDLAARQTLLASRVYDGNAPREIMVTQGAWANIRPMQHRTPPVECRRFLYRQAQAGSRHRHMQAANDLAAVNLAATRISSRYDELVT